MFRTKFLFYSESVYTVRSLFLPCGIYRCSFDDNECSHWVLSYLFTNFAYCFWVAFKKILFVLWIALVESNLLFLFDCIMVKCYVGCQNRLSHPHVQLEHVWLWTIWLTKRATTMICPFSPILYIVYCPYTYFTRETLSTTVTHVEVHPFKTSLDQGAFMNYIKLKHLNLPDGLKVISVSACSTSCVSHEKVIMLHSVKEISYVLFVGVFSWRKLFFQRDCVY